MAQKCEGCGRHIITDTKFCTNCGKQLKKIWYKRWWAITIFIIIGLVIYGNLADIGKKNREFYKEASETTKDFKQFTFDCPPEKITAYYAKMKDFDKFRRDQYLVQFEPPLMKTDGNLYLASFQCVVNIFQKNHGQGGLFLLESAEIKYDEILKNNVTYWKLPSGKGLYVIPQVDSKTGKLFAIIIYLK